METLTLLGFDHIYLIEVLLHATGAIVWTLILAYLLLYQLVYKLGVSLFTTYSYHRWVVKTETGKVHYDLLYVWSLINAVFLYYGCFDHRGAQYRAPSGAHWRSAFDYSYAGRPRTQQSSREAHTQ